ncbi:AAA family ATPase [Priestia megaterium]|uniref:AAA family ATPase n=1 Tax=Priestia megaterium TaxID=1404 RepID=UPI003D08E428
MIKKSYQHIGTKVIIIGSPGSGKSTFSKKLAEVTALPLIHLDDLYWEVGWVPTPEYQWQHIVKDLVKKDKYIIDGNYASSLDIRLQNADTVILLDTPLIICLYRIVKRTLQNKYETDTNLPKKIREANEIKKQKSSEGLLKFCLYVIKFHLFSKPNIKQKLEQNSDGKEIFIFKKTRQLHNFLDLGVYDDHK